MLACTPPSWIHLAPAYVRLTLPPSFLNVESCVCALSAIFRPRLNHVCLYGCMGVWCMGVRTSGLEVCLLGVLFLKFVVQTPRLLNPFCGQGTILAVANYFGLPATGR